MDRLFENLKKFKNKIALIGPDNKRYSYRYIAEKAIYMNSKIEKGSLILIIGSNNIESIIGYISFIKSNNVTLLLDKSFKVNYVNEIIKRYKPNYIFSPKEYFKKTTKGQSVISGQDYNLVKTNFGKHKKINKKNLLLLSTSGTTQNPKFIRLSKLNLVNNTNNIISYLNINPKHTTITTMSMAYSYGLSIINTHLFAGSKIVINNETIFDKRFWDKIYKFKVTSFGGVPQFYELLKKLKFEKMHLPHLKYLTQAGGELDKESLKYFHYVCKKKKVKFYVMYGQTEASPRMSYLEWNKLNLKLGSIGKPLKGSSFYILDKKKRYVKKPYSIGELIYMGKNVSLGYANSEKDLHAGDINKGKLFTGDLAYKDNDNYYYIVGRINRISKIFGIRINLDDIEKYLKKNNFNVKCVPDNNYIKILTKNEYNHETIKNFICNFYGINKNYIIISKVRQFMNSNYFKEVKKIF